VSNHLNNDVLVLNKNWFPIHVKSVREAICDVVSGFANVIDVSDSYLPVYEWEEWVIVDIKNDEDFIQSAKCKIKIPKVIVLKYYDDIPELEIRLTRKNLLLRDQSSCQYCNKRLHKDYTIDHVIPKSRGGKHTWDNVVACCFSCNSKKGNKTPKESRMSLLKKPIKPQWHPISMIVKNENIPEEWSKFITKNPI
jgi:5-methylcytosine-specific restriction endonuclease McrA